MNLYLLLLMTMLAAMMAVAWRFRDELGPQLVALGSLPYAPGGLKVPLRYTLPHAPYSRGMYGRNAYVFFGFESGVAATWNGKQLVLRRCNLDGSFTSIVFQWYVTTPPAGPIVGINVTGFTTATQVRDATATVLTAQGFYVQTIGAAAMKVTQPYAGTQGNIGNAALLAGLLTFVPYLGAPTPIYAPYGQTIFFHGYELSAPLRIGRIYGFAPVAQLPSFNGAT